MTDKSKYYLFHKIHYQDTNECVNIKDTIEELIKKGQLASTIEMEFVYETNTRIKVIEDMISS